MKQKNNNIKDQQYLLAPINDNDCLTRWNLIKNLKSKLLIMKNNNMITYDKLSMNKETILNLQEKEANSVRIKLNSNYHIQKLEAKYAQLLLRKKELEFDLQLNLNKINTVQKEVIQLQDNKIQILQDLKKLKRISKD